MRAVLQRVTWAKVEVDGQVVGAIDAGLLVLVGVEQSDTSSDAQTLAEKLTRARIFEDEQGKMNRSVLDVQGQLLLVSQFTLLGDLRSGRRPSFTEAMAPEPAKALFEAVCDACRTTGLRVQTGVFRAEMAVSLCNSGPVTLLLDTRRRF